MWQAITKFLRDEDGATAVEYALIAALIAIGIITAVTNLREELKAVFTTITNTLKGA